MRSAPFATAARSTTARGRSRVTPPRSRITSVICAIAVRRLVEERHRLGAPGPARCDRARAAGRASRTPPGCSPRAPRLPRPGRGSRGDRPPRGASAAPARSLRSCATWMIAMPASFAGAGWTPRRAAAARARPTNSSTTRALLGERDVCGQGCWRAPLRGTPRSSAFRGCSSSGGRIHSAIRAVHPHDAPLGVEQREAPPEALDRALPQRPRRARARRAPAPRRRRAPSRPAAPTRCTSCRRCSCGPATGTTQTMLPSLLRCAAAMERRRVAADDARSRSDVHLRAGQRHEVVDAHRDELVERVAVLRRARRRSR